jgi:hypothetical protein
MGDRGKERYPSVCCENPRELSSPRLSLSGAASMPLKKNARAIPISEPVSRRWPSTCPGWRMRRSPVRKTASVCGTLYSITSRAVRIWTPIGSVFTAAARVAIGRPKSRTRTQRDCARRVNQGGPAHFAFQQDWIVKAQRGEYPFELAETLACAFGRSTAEEWVEYAPRLSLLDQGILDKPCAPLLCVNGVDDSVFPIADMYLLLEHGSPKAARFYSGGAHGRPRASGDYSVTERKITLICRDREFSGCGAKPVYGCLFCRCWRRSKSC